MIIVIDLMRNIFVLMFFVLMALEILVLISLTTLYNIPLQNNQVHVENSSLFNTKEVLFSFNNILTRKYYNLETDLIMIAKHLYPMYLAQNPTVSANYPSFQQSSNFYKSYSGCLQSGVSYNSTSKFFPNMNITNGITNGFNIIKDTIAKNNFFLNNNEDEIITKMFNEFSLNYLMYYPNYSSTDFQNVEQMETYLCYALSIFKTLFIRNLIFEKNKMITNKFYIFNHKIIFSYPVDYLDGNTLPYMNYYDKTCKQYSGSNCIRSLSNFYKNKNLNSDKDIYFDTPYPNNGQIVARGCIKIKFTNNVYPKEDFSCIDFNLDNILKQIEVGPNHNLVNLFLISKLDNDDLSLFYTNVFDVNSFNSTIFGDPTLGTYKSSSTSYIQLFHAVYYELFMGYYGTQLQTDVYLTEYNALKKELLSLIAKFEQNATMCDTYTNFNQSISLSQSVFRSKLDVTGNIKNKIETDTIQYVLYPVKLNYTSYDNSTYVFQNGCSSRILYYSLAKVRVGSETIPGDVYHVLIMKCVRNWFFFISLLLFANIVYYIVCEIYVKFLVSPIKLIRSSLEKLIKERNSDEVEEVEREKETSENNKDKYGNKVVEETKYYRNKETKKLEKKLIFLKKIVMMKQAEGNMDYKVKSNIYQKFSKCLENMPNKENYLQCLLIMAYARYKGKNFRMAYSALEKIKEKIEIQESEYIDKKNNIEQKLINIPSLIHNNQYPLNEFTNNEIADPELNQLVKIRIFKQKILYLYGLIKYLDYQKKKHDLKQNNQINKENLEKLNYLLEDAIKYFKKALEINNTMNFNQIKSIFILIMIAKCMYYLGEKDHIEATNNLKEALLKFSDLNKSFFDKKLNTQIDPRVMFVTNGIIMEQILYYLAKICDKSNKKQLAGWIINKLMEISYFKSNDIDRKSTKKLYSYLYKENDNQNSVKRRLLERVSKRLQKDPPNKNVCVMVSENLLKNFGSSYELREVILKCLEKNLNQNDKVSYFQFSHDIYCEKPGQTKVHILKHFAESSDFCRQTPNVETKRADFQNALEKAVEYLTTDDEFYKEKYGASHTDNYIFSFLYSKDFNFRSTQERVETKKKLLEHNVSLYTFCFDEFTDEEKYKKIKKNFLQDLVEGYLIIVKNFKIIKQAFQNISNKGSQKNILNSDFESHKYII